MGDRKADQWREQMRDALRATDNTPRSASEENLTNAVLETVVAEMSKDVRRVEQDKAKRNNLVFTIYYFDDDSALIWINDGETGKWSLHSTTVDYLTTEEGVKKILECWVEPS